MTSPVRIAVVGLGQRGLQHLDALWKLQSEGLAQLVALTDAFPANLEDAKIRHYVQDFALGEIPTFTRFQTMLDAIETDAILFAIPPSRHNGEVLAATKRGLAVFVEKPMSLYLDEALEMERAIHEAGVVSTVGFQQRYDARHESIADFLRDKRPVMATFISHSPLESHSVKHTLTESLGGPPNRVWTASFEWSGSTVVEAGIHQTDLLRYWFGDIAWVQANYIHRDAEDIVDGGDNPYAYAVTYGFERGAVANLILSRLRKVFHGESYFSVQTTHAHLTMEGNEAVAYYYDGVYPPLERPRRDALRHPLPLPKGEHSTLAINRAFLEAVRMESEAGLRSTFSSGMNSLTATLGANVSDRLGGKRVYLEELLRGECYASFRRKPELT